MRNLISILIQDSIRYGGRNFLRIWFRDPRFRAVVLLRLGCSLHKFGLFRKSWLSRWLKNRLCLKYGIDTGFSVRIGPGIKIVHLGGIIIHQYAEIGRQLTILNNVTIGQSTEKVQVPIIGDKVKIGVFSAILGNVTIGDDVTVGSHTLVNKSIGNSKVVVGVPAQVIKG
jgi:serine O-acetyltransferase